MLTLPPPLTLPPTPSHGAGEPDGLERHIPSVFVQQLSTEVLAKYGHFGVLNRPHSVVEGLKLPALLERITEEVRPLTPTPTLTPTLTTDPKPDPDPDPSH